MFYYSPGSSGESCLESRHHSKKKDDTTVSFGSILVFLEVGLLLLAQFLCSLALVSVHGSWAASFLLCNKETRHTSG